MLIRVKVYPGAGKEEFIKKSDNSFEIWVKEKPVKGQANRAVVNSLIKNLNIDRESIRLVKGGKSRNKVFEIQ